MQQIGSAYQSAHYHAQAHAYTSVTHPTIHQTRCVHETLMPLKHPSFEKHDPDF